jgi:hypothetical protein
MEIRYNEMIDDKYIPTYLCPVSKLRIEGHEGFLDPRNRDVRVLGYCVDVEHSLVEYSSVCIPGD